MTDTSRTNAPHTSAPEMSDADFDALLQTFVGQEAGDVQLAPDVVNVPMVRHWCEAIGDDNPVYLDAEAAAASVHRELVAPPTMLQAWVMSGIQRSPRNLDSPYEQMNQLLFSRGFTSVVATNCDQTYHRYLHPGDQLTMRTVIDAISPQKTTGLGTGHFITTRQDYFDGDGEPVGSMLFRIIRFRPPVKPATPAPRPPRPEAATTLDNHWWFQALADGELRVQRCMGCTTLRHPPGPMCPTCHSMSWDSVPAAPTGTIHSFVVVHYPVVGSFDYPLPVVLVDLDDMPGIRIIMNAADSALELLEIGASVHIEVRDADDRSVPDGVRLPFAIVEPKI